MTYDEIESVLGKAVVNCIEEAVGATTTTPIIGKPQEALEELLVALLATSIVSSSTTQSARERAAECGRCLSEIVNEAVELKSVPKR
ncbi:MAG: hypothetical protein JSS20_15510 [Proteobacteria bacterium]|nr:hypothetical protein [Pseudomonadota bacterium]